MNSKLNISYYLFALVMALQIALPQIPPDLLPPSVAPWLPIVLTFVAAFSGRLNALYSAPAGMTLVPTESVTARPGGTPMLGLVLALALLPLGACATYEAQTPQQQIYAAQKQYTAAVLQAAAYEARPRCGSPGADPAMCSDPATLAALRRADSVVFPALQAARASPTQEAATALTAALAAFRASLSEIAS